MLIVRSDLVLNWILLTLISLIDSYRQHIVTLAVLSTLMRMPDPRRQIAEQSLGPQGIIGVVLADEEKIA